MQWKNIYDPGKLLYTVFDPIVGSIPYQVSHPLRRLLYSTDEDRCFFGFWQGYGSNYRSYVPPTLSIDTGAQREYDLYIGLVTMLDMPFLQYGSETASVIWAYDRSWWLTNDIDLDTTYIGGSKQLVDSFLKCDELEVWEVDPAHDITELADRLNV